MPGKRLITDGSQRLLRALIVEDDPLDAELVVQELKSAGFEPVWHRVDTEASYVASLTPDLDIILADFNMPEFGALRALELLRARGLDHPFIVVSGSIGEEIAVHLLKSGAADYLLKDRLTRLGQAVLRAVDERRLERAKREADRALEAAEERTRFALEASGTGVWEVDIATGAAQWSQTLEALHGMAPGTFDGTIAAFLERIHPEDRQPVRETLEATTPQHTDANLVYRTVWPDGSLHWITFIGRVLYAADGKPLRAAGIGIDVTERRVLEEQFRQSQKMEAIGQLAGGVAHDFNNLLTAIQGYCQLVVDDLGPLSPLQADLGEIQRAATRAASLTRQLLAFSRRQVLESEVLDLHDCLRAMEAMLKRLIGENITVVVEASQDVGRIKGDPGQIEQVILNLVLNARDAMPQGGTLLMKIAKVELDHSFAHHHLGSVAGSYVMLAVSDTGIGMDAATKERIFEPFFTTKEQGRGTGLGLPTVYGIVKQSGGSIEVQTALGRGSTFTVYLPSVKEPPAPAVQRRAPTSLDGSETILVVEDEALLRELVQKLLERHGYQVIMTATPQEALDSSRDQTLTIHLLLSDVVMPEMNGTVLAERILALRPTMRVLYMSGYTEIAMIGRGPTDSPFPFIQKPFSPEALLRRVREVLEQPWIL